VAIRELTTFSPGLGQQAVQLIIESVSPLSTLTHLSQNFPKYSPSIARRVQVSPQTAGELAANSQKVQPGVNYFWINGARVEENDMSILKLVGVLKKEKNLMRTITGLGLEKSESLKVLSHSAVASAQKDGGVTDGLFDASDRIEGGGVVVWWNDLEKDKRYSFSFVHILLVELTKSCQLREMESLPVQCACFCILGHHTVAFNVN